ncbi:hypothetical protein GCM10010388_35410 [Streptomyces mauvecolor]
MSPRSTVRYDWEQALWNCPDVPGKYKHVLAAASFFATFETGRDIRAPQTLISECSGASDSSVYRALKWGRANGWLWREHKSTGEGDCDIHWLTIPKHDHRHTIKAVKARIGITTPVTQTGVTGHASHTDELPRESYLGNSTKGVPSRELNQGSPTEGASAGGVDQGPGIRAMSDSDLWGSSSPEPNRTLPEAAVADQDRPGEPVAVAESSSVGPGSSCSSEPSSGAEPDLDRFLAFLARKAKLWPGLEQHAEDPQEALSLFLQLLKDPPAELPAKCTGVEHWAAVTTAERLTE